MSISLNKGGNLSLSKEAPGLTNILIGLGWDTRSSDGQAFDLDASAFLLKSSDGSVEHTGDNLTGEGEGDDEAIKVDLGRVPPEIHKISVAVTIHDAETRRQNFGMVTNAFIRVVNAANNSEITRYDLSEDASTETAMIFGELYRHGAEWKFRAVGQGYNGGLGPLARNFGVNV
jgi:tellurium resistance protein TerD